MKQVKKFNAVLEGGGVRGIAHVGALKRMEEEGVQFEGLAGTSAGAIVAALYAAGYSTDELRILLMETNFSDFLDFPWLKLWRIVTRRGIYEGLELYGWIYDHLKSKGVEFFGDLSARELKIIASDITHNEKLLFNKADYPKMRIAEAVRMSAGIPLFFQAWRSGEALVVDGGLLSNYPIWAFAGSDVPTLGLKLVSQKQVSVPKAPGSFVGFLWSMISTMRGAHDKEDAKKIGASQTIHISTGTIGTTQFKLTKKDKDYLYNSGYQAATEYIQKNSNVFQAARPVTPSEVRTMTDAHPAWEVFESIGRIAQLGSENKDQAFLAIEVHRNLSILPPDARMEAAEELLNMSGKEQSELVRFFVTDAPTDASQLKLEAHIKIGDNEIDVSKDVEASKDGRRFKIHMKLKGQVVKPNGRIFLRWSYCAPGAVQRNQDYWVIPINYFEHPVSSLVVEAGFLQNPVDLDFSAITEAEQKPLTIVGPASSIPAQGSPLYVFQATIDSPKEKTPLGLFLLRWKLE